MITIVTLAMSLATIQCRCGGCVFADILCDAIDLEVMAFFQHGYMEFVCFAALAFNST
ncbi:MAG TPA: hypothetical protein VMV97_02945 [Sulfuriferula sp.]|nr:hypothetical protein [Sulfuriferula sp.]